MRERMRPGSDGAGERWGRGLVEVEQALARGGRDLKERFGGAGGAEVAKHAAHHVDFFRKFGVDGISSDFVFTGITEIDVTTGSNQDFLRVRFFTPVCPELSIDTGAGLSDVIVRYELTDARPAATNVIVTGGSTHDKVDFQVESLASSFTADWNVQHGAGNNESKASINSPENSQRMDVSLITATGTGLDVYDVNVISAAATLLLDIRNNAGGGNDGSYVQVQELRSATTTVRFAQNLGGGDDTFDSTIIKVGGTARVNGSVAGAAGLDTLKLVLEGNGVINATLNGGAGSDSLDVFAKGNITGTPRQLGGDGNDFLKLVIDGPRTATPFFDGGPGYDEAIGFGTFVNVEKIN